jgi:energy-coupling factor transporter ATP-binding protein EcfA2
MDLREFEGKAKAAAGIIQHVLVNELRLMSPISYVLTERNGLVWLLAIMDTLNLGRNIEAYADKKTVHHLSTALHGVYVGLANHTGLRYAVLLSRKPALPKMVEFPGFEGEDVFRFGMGLMQEVSLTADQLQNAIISGPPGAGKSNLLELLGHTMRKDGYVLYLADPQGHTFNPDVWSNLAAAPVAGSLDEVRRLLAQMDGERQARQAKYRAAAGNGIPPENLAEYRRVSGEKLPRFALLFDESNTWLKQVLEEVTDLARQIRKFGGQVILAGHDWHASDIPRSLSAQFATRIALSSTDDTAARVILNSDRWGRWTMNKPAGRAVVRNQKYGYAPTQIYRVTGEMQREWLAGSQESLPVLSRTEQMVFELATEEADGKISLENLMGWGLGQGAARRLQESWKLRGWAENDPARSNGLYITPNLSLLATNLQTLQTPTNRLQTLQTDLQTAYKPTNPPTNPFLAAGAAD